MQSPSAELDEPRQPGALPPHRMAVEYSYTALEPDDCTRLVLIKPGIGDQLLMISIVNTKLEPGVKFETLSLYSGYSDPTASVLIEGRGALHNVCVEPSLRRALLALRLTDRERLVWIQDLCINKEDRNEMSLMVTRMRKVFDSSQGLLIWFPLTRPDGGYCVIKRAMTFEDILSLMKQAPERAVVLSITSNDWFTTRWSLVHLASHDKARIMCDESSADWTELHRFLWLMRGFYHKIVNDQPAKSVGWDIIATAKRFFASDTYAFFKIQQDLRTIDPVKGFVPTYSLERVVSLLDRFKSKEAADLCYAALPLALDPTKFDSVTNPCVEPRGLVIDYNKSAKEILCRFVVHVIKSSGGRSDILLRSWGRAMSEGAISWMRGVRPQTYCPFYQPIAQRELIGTVKEPLFAASGPFPPPCCTPKLDRNFNIVVRGFVVDQVASISRPVHNVIPSSWLAFCGFSRDVIEPPKGTKPPDKEAGPPPKNQGKLPAKLWQTLIAARDLDGEPASKQYKNFCEKALGNKFHMNLFAIEPEALHTDILELLVTSDGCHAKVDEAWKKFGFDRYCPTEKLRAFTELNTITTKGIFQLSYLEGSKYHMFPAMSNFLKQKISLMDEDKLFQEGRYRRLVHSTVLGRCMFHSMMLSLGGLVPEDAQLGDLICIINGCSVPVILRKVGIADGHGLASAGKKVKRKDAYKIIGEAYVHGMMEGEALSLGHAWKNFALV